MPVDLDLPQGCILCHGAPHVVKPSGGAQRCTCARGRALYDLDMERKHAPRGSVSDVAKKRSAVRAKSKRDSGKAAANDKPEEMFP